MFTGHQIFDLTTPVQIRLGTPINSGRLFYSKQKRRRMKNLLLILFCLALNGCATFQISELEKKGPDYSLVENLSYSKKEIFDVLSDAIKNASDSSLIVRSSDFEKGEVYAQNSYLTTMGTSVIGYYGAKKIMFGVFLKGDNPTQVKI